MCHIHKPYLLTEKSLHLAFNDLKKLSEVQKTGKSHVIHIETIVLGKIKVQL